MKYSIAKSDSQIRNPILLIIDKDTGNGGT